MIPHPFTIVANTALGHAHIFFNIKGRPFSPHLDSAYIKCSYHSTALTNSTVLNLSTSSSAFPRISPSLFFYATVTMGAPLGTRWRTRQILRTFIPGLPGPTPGESRRDCRVCFKVGAHCNGICPGPGYYAPGGPGNLDGNMPFVEIPPNYKLPPQ